METDIIVDKQLILQGVDSELGGGSGVGRPLIINSGDDKKVILVTSDGCRISGFHIRSTGCCSWGIYLYHSNNSQVYQNEIDNINFGIYLRESLYNKVYKNEVSETQQAISNSYISHNNLIFDNNVYDNGYGIFISNYAENITVYNNSVSNINAIGIKSSKSNNNTIHGNKITACNQGIGLWMEDYYGNKNTIYNNLITSCGRGISVTGKDHKIYNNSIFKCKYGLLLETLLPSSLYCSKNIVYENNINSCDTGIRLDIVYTTDIYRNNITECKSKGLFLEESELNNIFENNVTYNDHGIYLLNSEGNVIYHNNIIENTENAWCWGHTDRWNLWNLDLTKDGGGNYWDDYDGKDRNGDNVGDRPYIIPDFDENPFNNNKDYYPLMHPWGEQRPVANYTYFEEYGGYVFNASSYYDRDGEVVSYEWDFGDGASDNGMVVSHSYNESGTYDVTLIVEDDEGYKGNHTMTIDAIQNYPPDKPTIDGPDNGGWGKPYHFTFQTSDSEGSDVWYFVDWGDGKDKGWMGPYTSGEEITDSHTWTEQETFTIRCKAKDMYNIHSDWSEHEITIPRTRASTYHWLFEHFPLLERLLGLLL